MIKTHHFRPNKYQNIVSTDIIGIKYSKAIFAFFSIYFVEGNLFEFYNYS